MARDILQRIVDPATRADPYPVFAELRDQPVVRLDDGSVMVGGYHDIVTLLHEPRVSIDPLSRAGADPATVVSMPMMITSDPPVHDRLRGYLNRFFAPPESPRTVLDQLPFLEQVTGELLDALPDERADLVADFAYPLPVSVICHLLGVPREDEPKFRAWSSLLVGGIDKIGSGAAADVSPESQQALFELFDYLTQLLGAHRSTPSACMLARMANDKSAERLDDTSLAANGMLLLFAGHETTVNMIANGILTLLRHPDELERLRADPSRVTCLVEELLRFEPAVQYSPNHWALDDFELQGETVAKGEGVVMALAAANRDPRRFDDPDRFWPERPDNEHISFGRGLHYCFGAPLARVQLYTALNAFAQRVDDPALVADPPPYRESPVLRGPSQLDVSYAAIRGR